MNKPLTMEELFFGPSKEFEPTGEIDVTNVGDEYDAVLADIEAGKYDAEISAVEQAYTPFDTDEAGETRINKDHESRSSLQDLIEAADDTADNREVAVKHERVGDAR